MWVGMEICYYKNKRYGRLPVMTIVKALSFFVFMSQLSVALSAETIVLRDIFPKIQKIKEAGLGDSLSDAIKEFEEGARPRTWENKDRRKAEGQILEFDEKNARFLSLSMPDGQQDFSFLLRDLSPRSRGTVRKLQRAIEEINNFYTTNNAEIKSAYFLEKFGLDLSKLPSNFESLVTKKKITFDGIVLVSLKGLDSAHIKHIGEQLPYIALDGLAVKQLNPDLARSFADTECQMSLFPNPAEIAQPYIGVEPEILKSLAHSEAVLSFPEVSRITKEFAAAVTDHRGNLRLRGVKTIDSGAGEALASKKGQVEFANTAAPYYQLKLRIADEDWNALKRRDQSGFFAQADDYYNHRKTLLADVGGLPDVQIGCIRLGMSLDELGELVPRDSWFAINPAGDPRELNKSNVPSWMYLTGPEEVKIFETGRELAKTHVYSFLNHAFTYNTIGMHPNDSKIRTYKWGTGNKRVMPDTLKVYVNTSPKGLQGIRCIMMSVHRDLGVIDFDMKYQPGVPAEAVMNRLTDLFGKPQEKTVHGRFNLSAGLGMRKEMVARKTKDGGVRIGLQDQYTNTTKIETFWDIGGKVRIDPATEGVGSISVNWYSAQKKLRENLAKEESQLQERVRDENSTRAQEIGKQLGF